MNKKEGHHIGCLLSWQSIQTLQGEGKIYADGKQVEDAQKHVNI